MEQKKFKKIETLYFEKCEECNKEITGYSEIQVKSRMKIHKRSHDKE